MALATLVPGVALLGLGAFSITRADTAPRVAENAKAKPAEPAKPKQPVPVQIMHLLQEGGLDEVAAAGIAGNALQESSWDPASQGMGGGGLWGFTASPVSLTEMQAWAAERDMPWDTVRAQTLFLLENLHIHDSLFLERLNQTGSPEEAAALFCWEWERPYVPTANLERRVWGAQRALEMFRSFYG